MSGLKVIAIGPGAGVQDAGRTGFRRFGVPVSGAMDAGALARANLAVGNAPGAAAVELALAGATFEALTPVAAAAGGPVTLRHLGRTLPAGVALRLDPGDRVAVSAPDGVWGYLALAGGVQTAPAMGSRSLHARSGLGGRWLRAGDVIPALPAPPGHPLLSVPAPAADTGPIRVVPGPQAGHFPPEAMAALLAADWRVGPRSDRMGTRLEGPALDHLDGWNIVSDGVVPGSVQVPGDGAPIVLMRDCQTTGGYPKIATVISADLDRLAQVPPGGTLRFVAVDAAAAVAAARRRAAALAAMAAAARPATGLPDAAGLLALNLVGGVVSARD